MMSKLRWSKSCISAFTAKLGCVTLEQLIRYIGEIVNINFNLSYYCIIPVFLLAGKMMDIQQIPITGCLFEVHLNVSLQLQVGV